MEEIVVTVEETDNPVIKTDVAKYGYNEYATIKTLMTIAVMMYSNLNTDLIASK